MRWTLARAMRSASGDTMIAPSSLASSDRRCGLNSASSRNPPVQTDSTSGVVADHDAAAPRLAMQDALEPVAQRLARRDEGQGVGHGRARSRHHLRMVPGAAVAPSRSPPTVAAAPRRQLDGLRQRAHVHQLHPRRARRDTTRARRAWRNPTRAASASRRGAWGTWRISPAEPDLAERHQIGGSGRAVDRRGDGQRQGQVGGGLDDADARRPPSRRRRCARTDTPARFSSTASSRPGGPRRRPGPSAGAGCPARRPTPRAWTSTSRARWPSHGRAARRCPARRAGGRRAAAGRGRSPPRRPASPISKSPSSPVGPKRCLMARTEPQRVVAVALDGEHRVDEVLERARARPGSRPW